MKVKEYKALLKGVLDRVHPSSWEFIRMTQKQKTAVIGNSSSFSINFNDLKLHDSRCSSSSFFVCINYPKIQITNSKGFKLNIKDLFIFIPIVDEQIISTYGYKLAYSPNELAAGYLHSHCPNPGMYAQLFCTGSVGIATYYKVLKPYNTLSVLEFESFLYELESFLSWESLEGGPYRKIRDVLFKTDSMNSRILLTPEFKKLLPDYMEVYTDYETKSLSVVLHDEEELLKKSGTSTLFVEGSEVYLLRNTNETDCHLPQNVTFKLGNLTFSSYFYDNDEITEMPVGQLTSIPVNIKNNIIDQLNILINKTFLWIRTM